MPSDARAQQARHHHQAAADMEAGAEGHRRLRNTLMRQLRRDGWTYVDIARAVGCSPELVAAVAKGRTGVEGATMIGDGSRVALLRDSQWTGTVVGRPLDGKAYVRFDGGGAGNFSVDALVLLDEKRWPPRVETKFGG